MKFTCELCKKEVKRGDKFRVETDKYEDDFHLTGETYEDSVCKSCHDRIKSKIDSMRK